MTLPDNRYILFRREWDPVKQKWNKFPCDYTGKNIDAHKPENWMSKANASQYPTWNDNDSSKPYGLAWVLNGDGWFFIDMDNCHVNGDWTTDASALFQSFGGCLGEVSTSGTGLHIFGRCDPDQLKDRKNKWDGDKEFYTHGRFVALSKDGPRPIGGTPTDKDWTQQLLHVVPEREYLGELPDGVDPAYTGPDDDDALLKMAMRSGGAAAAFGDGVSFADLWEARTEPLSRKYPAYDAGSGFDHSSADAALMTHLAFWTGKDMPRMDRLFRRSALMRDKYAKRADYRRDTIQKSARLCKAVYSTKAQDKHPLGLTENAQTLSSLAAVEDFAKAFLSDHEQIKRWKHDHTTGTDLCYDGQLWKACQKQELLQTIREFVCHRAASDKTNHKKPAFWEEVRKAVRIDPVVAVGPGELDAGLNLLNTPNGTIDLQTGRTRPHSADDLLTQITKVAPKPYAGSRFERFIKEICGHDPDLPGYLQVMFGSTLSGAVHDHWFAFLHGQGRNGKSLLIEAILEALGSYGIVIPSVALMATKNPQSKDVFAQLPGKRLVVTSEVDSNAHFDEALIKQLTGDELISAKALYRATFCFPRTFKLIMVGNHRPQIRNDDTAMRSRLRLCELNQDFSGAKSDHNLKGQLKSEKGCVLQWLIDGHKMWRGQGNLGTCDHVDQQIQDYFETQSTVKSWISERLMPIQSDGRPASRWKTSSELYDDYERWCKQNGTNPFPKPRWSDAMKANGFRKVNSNGVRYIGAELIAGNHMAHFMVVKN